MVKFNEVKLSYTCPSFPPDGISMDKAYSINKDSKGFFLTDGKYVEYVNDLSYVKMLFTPNGDVKWEDVDFSEIKLSKK